MITLAGKGVTCQLDRLPELTKWLSDQTSTSLKKASDDLNVFLQAASNENVPVEDRKALLNVVQLVQELSNGKCVYCGISKAGKFIKAHTCQHHTNFIIHIPALPAVYRTCKAACIDFQKRVSRYM